MSKQKTKVADKKRHGQHKKHTHSYRKVYWPYIPMLIMLLFVLTAGSLQPKAVSRVLGLATGIDRAGLLEETNEERKKFSQPVLKSNHDLDAAAQAKALDMRNRRYWSHQSPDGIQPWIFIDNTGYKYQKAGENLAYGFLSNDAAVSGWMNSESHRANLLDNDFTEVGFGIVDASDYVSGDDETIVVALYAQPAVRSDPGTLLTASVSSDNNPPQSSIPFAATFIRVNPAWLTFISGIVVGAGAVFLIIRHSLRLKRLARSGEEFVMHHPVLDLTVTALIVIFALLGQSSGVVF